MYVCRYVLEALSPHECYTDASVHLADTVQASCCLFCDTVSTDATYRRMILNGELKHTSADF
jgi:hypothetical protein